MQDEEIERLKRELDRLRQSSDASSAGVSKKAAAPPGRTEKAHAAAAKPDGFRKPVDRKLDKAEQVWRRKRGKASVMGMPYQLDCCPHSNEFCTPCTQGLCYATTLKPHRIFFPYGLTCIMLMQARLDKEKRERERAAFREKQRQELMKRRQEEAARLGRAIDPAPSQKPRGGVNTTATQQGL
jgi:hypothetical protein